jgi:hypothetical protein
MYFYLDHNEDEPISNEHNDEFKSDSQRYSNGNRMPPSTFETHRGDDFYKKLMFYEKNASSNNNTNTNNANNNNNGYHQSSSRRSSFQQPPSSSSIPSNNRTFNNLMNRQTQQIPSRPNLASATPLNKQSTTTANIADRMQRSKSYKDLFDPPSASPTNAHHVYYQQQSSANRSSQNINPSTITTSANNINNNNLYPYYTPSYYYQNNNGTNSSNPTAIVGSMLGSSTSNGSIEQHNHLSGLTDFQRRQQPLQHSSSSNNLILDDPSSSSTVSHLPKPPPGIPSQNARYVTIFIICFEPSIERVLFHRYSFSRSSTISFLILFVIGVVVTKWII